MLDVEFSQLSDRGRVRPRNEDYLGYVVPRSPAEARSHGWLFALADGVGGQRQGEVASRAAIEEVVVRQVRDVTAVTPVQERRDAQRSIVELVGKAHREFRILITKNVEVIHSAHEGSA